MQKIINTILFVSVLLISAGCGEKSNTGSTDKVKIGVTIQPYFYLVDKIGKNIIEPVLSVPPGASPHHFEPTPGLIKDVSDVDYYFKVGGNFEFEKVWLEKLISLNDTLKVTDLSAGIDLIDDDPHIWLSPGNVKVISVNIYRRLSEILPGEKELFKKNLNSFLDSLNLVNGILEEELAPVKNKHLLVYHSAWKYFCRDFGFKETSIDIGSRTPGAKTLEEIYNLINEYKIPVLFGDPQHDKSTAENLSSQLNMKMDIINPLPGNLLDNFLSVKDKILEYYE